MQRPRSKIESVPEDVDMNLGSSLPSDGITQETYLSNRLNQEGMCSSSYASSSESSSSLHIAGDADERLHTQNFGQPSFAMNWESRVNFEGTKVEHDWSPSVGTSVGTGPNLEARQSELHHNVLFPETVVTRNPSANLTCCGPSINPILNLEPGAGTSTVCQLGNSLHLSGSSSHMDGRMGCSSTSLAAWSSSSGKRKTLDGTSGQSNSSASSTGVLQNENSAWPNETPPLGNSPDTTNSLPSTLLDSRSGNSPEHMTPSTELNVREAAIEPFPSLNISVGMRTTNALRNFNRRGSLWPQQEPSAFLSPSTISSLGSSTHPSGYSLSRPGSSSSFLGTRSRGDTPGNAGVPQTSLSSAIQAPQFPRNAPRFPWRGVLHSRNNHFNSSFHLEGSRDEANPESLRRYISETPVVSPAAETSNMGQDSPGWDLAAGFTSHMQDLPSNRISHSSSSHPQLPPFVTSHSMGPEMQRLLDLVPWAPESFHAQNSNLHALPSSSVSSSSPSPTGGNFLGHRRPYHRHGFSAGRQSDDLLAMSESPVRVFIQDFEERNRAIAEIRQVLNAMRRGENLRAQDYGLFEPLMFQSLTDMRDQHREMRLDVDNMSYEELLELEERIGDVSTGLNEETIMKFLKQQKNQISTGAGFAKDLEPCCICQEQYVDGDEIGELDCGHDFHVNCIKQWLRHKNVCPICKTTGLVT
ncbi:hypothetical protein SAY87_017774 [Trapa incisa]|uniref:RING-type E3 ubiquitin transferase n=1 Tax=Trapa incisa TaxID=236973 RepID=A0AAN7QT79_9MYRT|nr:hypothetical protein SAY87_017774 [Trapa incisa]